MINRKKTEKYLFFIHLNCIHIYILLLLIFFFIERNICAPRSNRSGLNLIKPLTSRLFASRSSRLSSSDNSSSDSSSSDNSSDNPDNSFDNSSLSDLSSSSDISFSPSSPSPSSPSPSSPSSTDELLYVPVNVDHGKFKDNLFLPVNDIDDKNEKKKTVENTNKKNKNETNLKTTNVDNKKYNNINNQESNNIDNKKYNNNIDNNEITHNKIRETMMNTPNNIKYIPVDGHNNAEEFEYAKPIDLSNEDMFKHFYGITDEEEKKNKNKKKKNKEQDRNNNNYRQTSNIEKEDEEDKEENDEDEEENLILIEFNRCIDAEKRGYMPPFVCCTMADGDYNNIHIWSCHRIPTFLDAVFIRHYIRLSDNILNIRVRALWIIKSLEKNYAGSNGGVLRAGRAFNNMCINAYKPTSSYNNNDIEKTHITAIRNTFKHLINKVFSRRDDKKHELLSIKNICKILRHNDLYDEDEFKLKTSLFINIEEQYDNIPHSVIHKIAMTEILYNKQKIKQDEDVNSSSSSQDNKGKNTSDMYNNSVRYNIYTQSEENKRDYGNEKEEREEKERKSEGKIEENTKEEENDTTKEEKRNKSKKNNSKKENIEEGKQGGFFYRNINQKKFNHGNKINNNKKENNNNIDEDVDDDEDILSAPIISIMDFGDTSRRTVGTLEMHSIEKEEEEEKEKYYGGVSAMDIINNARTPIEGLYNIISNNIRNNENNLRRLQTDDNYSTKKNTFSSPKKNHYKYNFPLKTSGPVGLCVEKGGSLLLFEDVSVNVEGDIINDGIFYVGEVMLKECLEEKKQNSGLCRIPSVVARKSIIAESAMNVLWLQLTYLSKYENNFKRMINDKENEIIYYGVVHYDPNLPNSHRSTLTFVGPITVDRIFPGFLLSFKRIGFPPNVMPPEKARPALFAVKDFSHSSDLFLYFDIFDADGFINCCEEFYEEDLAEFEVSGVNLRIGKYVDILKSIGDKGNRISEQILFRAKKIYVDQNFEGLTPLIPPEDAILTNNELPAKIAGTNKDVVIFQCLVECEISNQSFFREDPYAFVQVTRAVRKEK